MDTSGLFWPTGRALFRRRWPLHRRLAAWGLSATVLGLAAAGTLYWR